MLRPQSGLIGVVCLEGAKIHDNRSDARTFHEMAGGMPIPAGPALFQREIDHRPQHQRCGERMLSRERPGSPRQYFVVVTFQLTRSPGNERGRPVEGRPGHEK